MRMGKLKRCLAGFLAVATVLSSSSISYAMETVNPGADVTKTVKDVVIEEYVTDETVKSILESDLIVVGNDNVVTTNAPSNVDDLIEVNSTSEQKTVAAKKAGDWVPVSARIVPSNDEEEPIDVTLDETYVGEFEYVGSYSVEVTYQLSAKVDTEVQSNLVAIPEILAEGIESLETLKESEQNLGMVQEALPTLNDTFIKASLNKAGEGETTVKAIEALAEDTAANDGKLKLYSLSNAYVEETNGVACAIANGAAIAGVLETTYANLSAIYQSAALVTASEKNATIAKALEVLGTLVGSEGTLTDLVGAGYNWTVVADAEKTMFGEDGYVVTEAFEAAAYEYYEGSDEFEADVKEEIVIAQTVLTKTVNSVVANYEIKAQFASEIPDSVELTGMDVADSTKTVPAAEEGDENLSWVLNVLSNEVILLEDTAKDVIEEYELNNPEKYSRNVTITFADGTALDSDEAFKALEALKQNFTYTITYSPVDVAIVAEEGIDLPATVPYGSKITLPSHSDSAKVYDYTIVAENPADNEYYDQGSVIPVTEELTITRSEGDAKQTYTVADVVGKDTQYGFADAAKQILSSSAVISPVIKIRELKEELSEAIVSEITGEDIAGKTWYSVKAYPVTADDRSEMKWMPTDFKVYNGDKEVEIEKPEVSTFATRTSEEGTEFKWSVAEGTTFTNVEIIYSLEVQQINTNGKYEALTNATIAEYVKLPDEVITSVKTQQEVLTGTGVSAKNIYDKLKENAGFLKSTTLAALQMELDENGKGYAAIDTILDEGMTKTQTTDELAIYTSLKKIAGAQEDWDLVKYYRNNYYAELQAQAEFLAPLLDDIIHDDSFGKALEAAGGMGVNIEGKEDMLDSLASEIEELAGKIAGPHKLLNVKDDGFETVVNVALVAGEDAGAYNEEASDLYVHFEMPKAYTDYTFYFYVNGNKIDLKHTIDYGEGNITHTLTADEVEEVRTLATESALSNEGVEDEVGAKFFDVNVENLPIDKIDTEINAAVSRINIEIKEKSYTYDVVDADGNSLTGSEQKPTFVGKLARDEKNKVVKEENGNYVSAAKITLPAYTADDNHYYEYTVIGDTTSALTREVPEYPVVSTENGEAEYKIQNLLAFAEGTASLRIVRKTINKETQAMINFADTLNAQLAVQGTGLIEFVPVVEENIIADNGICEAMVLKMNSNEKPDVAAVVTAVVKAFESLPSYIGFAKEGEVENEKVQLPFLYVDNGLKLDPQAFVEMLLYSGLGTDAISKAFNEDGTSVDNVPVEEKAGLGAVLAESEIHLGADKTACTKLPFYLTVVSEASEYYKAMKKFVDLAGEHFTIDMSEGSVDINGFMPENVYKAYLSMQLMLGNKDIADINGSDSLKEEVLMLADELTEDIRGKVGYKQIMTTLKKYKVVEDTAKFEDARPYIETLIDATELLLSDDAENKNGKLHIEDVEDEKVHYGFTLVYNAESLFNKLDKEGMIQKYLANPTLRVPFDFTIKNLEEDVEAAILDLGQSGLDKLRYTANLAESLANLSGDAYVLLLEDIETDLTLNQSVAAQHVVLNLNGKLINADVNVGKHSLKIVDSVLDSDNAVGGIAGKINANDASSVRIASGIYTGVSEEDMDKMLHESYKYNVKTGLVTSKYYTVEATDDAVTVYLSSAFADMAEGNLQMMVLELVSDIFFDIYNTASVIVADEDGEYRLLDFAIEDIASGYTGLKSVAEKIAGCVDKAALKSVAQKLNAKFGDLNKVADAIERGGEIAAFDLTTSNWGIKAQLFGEEGNEYIGLSLAPKYQPTRKVTFAFKEASGAEKIENKKLADSLRALAEILAVEEEVSFDGISFTDGKLDIKGKATLNVTLDLQGDTEGPSNYVTALAAILAYSSDDKAGFKKDILDYQNNIYTGNLQKRIDAMTVQQLIDAMQAAKGVEFTEILKATDLRNELLNTIEVEKCYGPLLNIAYSLANSAERVITAVDSKIDQSILTQMFGGVKNSDGSYGGSLSYSDNLSLNAFILMFSEDYKPPVDKVLELLEQIPEDLKKIYDPENGVDNREEYLELIAEARKAYDELSDELKEYIPDELVARLEAAEKLFENMGVWVADIDDYTYTGKAIKPKGDEVRVYHGSKLLKEKTDYTLSYKYNTSAATEDAGSKAPRVIVKLKKNYKGTIYAYFTIKPIDLTAASNTEIDSVTGKTFGELYREEVGLVIKDVYKAATTKDKNLGKPSIKLNGKTVATSYYKLSWPDREINKNAYKTAGEYDIVITGKKNFIGTYTAKQYVETTLLSKVKVTAKSQYYNEGNPITLDGSNLVVKYGKLTLVEGVHFTTEYSNNINVGTATVKLIATGLSEADKNVGTDTRSFTGTKTVTFKIKANDKLTSGMVTMLNTELDNAGNILSSTPVKKNKYLSKVFTGSKIELVDGIDFKVVDGKNEDGTEHELIFGTDYTVSYKKNTNKGTATVTFKGIGNYTGSVKKSFKIKAAALNMDLLVSDPEIKVEYNKGGCKPSSEIILKYNGITLKSGKDYTLKFTNTTKVADANGNYAKDKDRPKVVITGTGNYSGKFFVYYTIMSVDIEEAAKLTVKDVRLDSKKNNNYKTTITLKDLDNGKKLTAKTDYSTAYTYKVWDASKNDYVDIKTSGRLNSKGKIQFIGNEAEEGIKMQVTVAGKGRYTDDITATYRIYKTTINSKNTKVKISETFTYNKYTQEIPADKLQVTYKKQPLVLGEDYEVTSASYKKNIFAGTATVTLKGINDFGGTYTKKFIINPYKQNAVNVADASVVLYLDGTAVTAADRNGKLTVDYQKGGVKALVQSKIKLEYVDPATGEAEPMVYGRDYKLSFSNYTKSRDYDVRKNAPTVKVTGVGNFKGSFKFTYSIVDATLGTDILWNAVKEIPYSTKQNNFKQSIKLVDVNGKKLKSGTDYTVTYYRAEETETETIYTKITKKMVDSKGRIKLTLNEQVGIKVVITGKGNYDGMIEQTYNFVRK